MPIKNDDQWPPLIKCPYPESADATACHASDAFRRPHRHHWQLEPGLPVPVEALRLPVREFTASLPRPRAATSTGSLSLSHGVVVLRVSLSTSTSTSTSSISLALARPRASDCNRGRRAGRRPGPTASGKPLAAAAPPRCRRPRATASVPQTPTPTGTGSRTPGHWHVRVETQASSLRLRYPGTPCGLWCPAHCSSSSGSSCCGSSRLFLHNAEGTRCKTQETPQSWFTKGGARLPPSTSSAPAPESARRA